MFKATIQFNNNLSTELKRQVTEIRKIPEEAYKIFVKETPVRKGNARRNTKLKGKKQIVADYPYAQKLNEGYSKQSPEGMIQPTEEYIVERFNQIMLGKFK